MKNRVFINGLSAISAQPTYDGSFLNNIIENNQSNTLLAVEPEYKGLISPAFIRRMSKGVKMSLATSKKALSEAKIEQPQAIIVGTSMGCVQDSEKFLRSMLDNAEEHLAPTAFIQSTHNTVAGQIALELKCKGLNFTFVNGSNSFESALLDAICQISLGDLDNALVGGIDEQTRRIFELYELDGIIKPSNQAPFDIRNAQTKGVVFSEGASFFVLSNQQSDHSYAQLLDVDFVNDTDRLDIFVNSFLQRNKLKISEIDLLISGRNGNSEDLQGYDLIEQLIPSPTLYYKHLVGEYYTASAFGLWVAAKILKQNHIPTSLILLGTPPQEPKKILIYNQFRGKGQSLVLVCRVSAIPVCGY